MKIIENNNETSKKKRGRPCAIDRYKNDLIQEKFTSMLNNGNTSNDEFTKLIVDQIVKEKNILNLLNIKSFTLVLDNLLQDGNCSSF